MFEFYRRPFLLLEFSGEPFNSVSALANASRNVMGKLSTIIQNFPKLRIIWARDANQAAKTLKNFAENQKQPDLTTALSLGTGERTISEVQTPPIRFLAKIPFLTTEQIERIFKKCGSLKELCKLSRTDLMTFLDTATAMKLYDLFHIFPQKS